MGIKHFKHDVRSAQDQKFIRLFGDYGAEGYGAYWLIVECLYQLESPVAEFQMIKNVIGSKCNENTLIAVIKNYGLFAESADGSTFYSPSILKEKETWKKMSRGGSKGMKTRWNVRKAGLDNEEEHKESTPPMGHDEQCVEQGIEETEMDFSKPSTQEVVIDKWNKIFEGTRQLYRGLTLDHISFQRLKETLDAGYSIEELEEAFNIARNDSFNWLLKDVLKQDNIQRLLVSKEKKEEAKNDKQQWSTTSKNDVIAGRTSESINAIDSVDWSEFEL